MSINDFGSRISDCGIAESERFRKLDEFIEASHDPVDPQGALIAVLQRAQEIFGYLPQDVMAHVADKLQVPEVYVWGVATFYSYFTLVPRGKYPIWVCMGTPCYVKGAADVFEALKEQLGIEPGQTTPDGLFSLVETKCVGSCALAPLLMVGENVHGHITVDHVPEILAKYREEAK
jgi:NADH:ubiquinone oxidoreductase subunit E